MSVESNTPFDHALIIETNLYAGNFERELCGYATASYGECEVGSEMAEAADLWFEEKGFEGVSDYTASFADDHGCHRPASIWNAKGNQGYNDVIIFFDTLPPAEVRKLIFERIEAYAAESRAHAGKGPDYSAGYRLRPRAGNLQIKKMSFVSRTTVQTDIIVEECNGHQPA